MTNPISRAALVAPVFGISLVLSACGTETISGSEIEEQANTSLTEEVGQAPASIDCPSDLDREVGAKETCTLTDEQGNEYDMTAEVSAVDGDTAELSFEVAPQAK